MDLEDPGRQPVLDRLAEVLREDVRDEEDELLPRLQRELDTATLRRLGVLWEVVRGVSPTRAHPVVARRPPGNVVAALPLTVVDRARDVLERVALRQPRVARRAAALDRRLSGLAHAVEKLPIMRSGEDPSTSRPDLV